MLSLHSEKEGVRLGAEPVATRELDHSAAIVALQQFGKLVEKIRDVELHLIGGKGSEVYIYGAFNAGTVPAYVTLDCANSEGVLFSTGNAQVRKTVLPESWEVLFTCVSDSSAPRVTLKPLYSVSIRNRV